MAQEKFDLANLSTVDGAVAYLFLKTKNKKFWIYLWVFSGVLLSSFKRREALIENYCWLPPTLSQSIQSFRLQTEDPPEFFLLLLDDIRRKQLTPSRKLPETTTKIEKVKPAKESSPQNVLRESVTLKVVNVICGLCKGFSQNCHISVTINRQMKKSQPLKKKKNGP